MMRITSNEKLIMSSVGEMSAEFACEFYADFDDDAAVSAMIDSIMSLEEAEDELFDHYANEVI